MEARIDEKIGEKPHKGIGLDSPFDVTVLGINVMLNCMCQGAGRS